MKIIIYDLEIKHGPLNKGEMPKDGVKYCEGWNDKAGMGISCLVAYEINLNTSQADLAKAMLDAIVPKARIFLDDNREQFAQLVAEADLIVGFNHLGFDNQVVAACWDLDVGLKPQYDIYAEIGKVVGRFQKGYKLGQCMEANGFGGKSGDGAYAPEDWQRGKIGAVIDYCSQDTAGTVKLFLKILADGGITSPVSNGFLALRKPPI